MPALLCITLIYSIVHFIQIMPDTGDKKRPRKKIAPNFSELTLWWESQTVDQINKEIK